MSISIAVIGAGVCGMATAVKIKEQFKDVEVVVISEDFSPKTTGDGSAGYWQPYLCGSTPQQKIKNWGVETYKFMHRMWLVGAPGISMLPSYSLYTNECVIPIWSREVYGFQKLNQKQIDYLSELHSTNYKSGFTFMSFTYEGRELLSYLMQRFLDSGGLILEAKIDTIDDPLLEHFEIVVNCTGLESRKIVSDSKVFPIRGQISKVKAPWINHIIMDQIGGNYIIPNVNHCVLGGTHQENNYDTSVSEQDTKFISSGCQRLMQSIKNAELIEHWVGLRPGREEIRLEPDIRRNGTLVIHNYGHGGSGVTLCWGCASEVVNILNELLPVIGKTNRSKL